MDQTEVDTYKRLNFFCQEQMKHRKLVFRIWILFEIWVLGFGILLPYPGKLIVSI
jgi:hypothetical protein